MPGVARRRSSLLAFRWKLGERVRCQASNSLHDRSSRSWPRAVPGHPCLVIRARRMLGFQYDSQAMSRAVQAEEDQ
jgi:hypothetical protein